MDVKNAAGLVKKAILQGILKGSIGNMYKMKSFIVLLTLLCFQANGQKISRPTFDKAPDELKVIVNNAIDCDKSGREGCSQLYREAIKLANAKNYKDYIGTLHSYLLRSYYYHGNDDSIIHYSPTAIENAGDEYYNLAVIYNLIGTAYINGASTDSALLQFQKAREYILKINDSLLLAENYSNIGGVYVDINDDKRALESYLQAYDIAMKINSGRYVGVASANIGLYYIRKRDFNAAKNWGLKAQKNAVANEDLLILSTSTTLLTEAYSELNNYDSASYYAAESIKTGKQIADNEYLATAYESHAKVLLKQRKYKEALNAANESVRLNKTVNNNKSLTRLYKVVADISYEIKDYKNAADQYRNMLDLVDTLLSDQNLLAVQEVREKYETEKKERLIAQKELVIEKKNAQMRLWLMGGGLIIIGGGLFMMQYRKMQMAKLAQAEQEKENAVLKAWMSGEERERNRISQELHDGVAAMIGAARMNLQALPHLPQEKQDIQLQKVSGILENTHVDVRRIAHNLLPVTLQKEGLIKAVQQFSNDINNTGIIQIKVEDNFTHLYKVNQQIQLMLFRIVQELINNTVKHSSATMATIRFAGTEQEMQIEVTDNGKGFSSKTEKENQGLFSIRQRLQALGGAFNINSKEGEGTIALLKIVLR